MPFLEGGASTVWPLTRVLCVWWLSSGGRVPGRCPCLPPSWHPMLSPRWRFMVPSLPSPVPEIVRRRRTSSSTKGSCLQAHRKLMDLECSRDGLMYEQYRMDSGNTRDMALIHSYFGEHAGAVRRVGQAAVDGAAEVTGHRAPRPHLARSLVRIIERED